MKPIVIYSRVSTLDQNFQSQIDDLKKWCITNNYNVVESFGENVSGFDPDVERIEYDKMKQYVLDKNIKDIAIWEISRLSRSMIKTVTELDFYTKNKINIHFKKEGIDSLSDNVTNLLLLTILSSMAQMERTTFIERGARGKMSAILKGKMLHSIPPYGYIKDNDNFWSINEEEAKIIRLIFDLAQKGDTLYKIAQHLNSLKVPTRNTIKGKKSKTISGIEFETQWQPFMISRNLQKTLYKGICIYKGNTINIPAIVTPEVWENVQKRFKDKVGYINKNKHEFLFKGMIRCGKCGRIFGTQTRNKKSSYYLCSSMTQPSYKCSNKGFVNTALIDDNLYPLLFDHKYIKQIMTQETSKDTKKEEIKKQIDYYNSELTALEIKGKRIKKLYTESLYTDDEFTKEMSLQTNKKIEIQNKIKQLENELKYIDEIDITKLIATYRNAIDYKTKRELVTKYINSITLYKIDVANVKWNTPLQKNESMIYIEMFAFNYNIPTKVLLTPYSKNILSSNKFQYLPDYNMVVDISISPVPTR